MFSALYSCVNGHVCILTRRFDPGTDIYRWAMPFAERCQCQWVVAPEYKNALQSCPGVGDESIESNDSWWYTDDKRPLTDRRNWNPEKLDQLLEP